jgi:hypothetical protein
VRVVVVVVVAVRVRVRVRRRMRLVVRVRGHLLAMVSHDVLVKHRTGEEGPRARRVRNDRTLALGAGYPPSA